MLWLALTRRPALIISTHPNFAPVGLLAKRLLGVRYVVVVHGIDIHPGLSALRKRALQQADAVWAVSRWTRERGLHIGVAADRLRVLSNTVDSQRFDVGAPDSDLRRRHAIAPGAKVLLTVARLDPAERYKGYDRVIEAVYQLKETCPSIKYLIVGKYDDKEKERLDALIARLSLQKHIILTGFIPDDAVAAHFNLADLYIMPSQKEGFGIVFIEAMFYGKAVIAGNIDGSTDALKNGLFGLLVNPAQQQEITDAIIKVFNNLEKYIPKHEEVLQYFSYDVFFRMQKILQSTDLGSLMR